MTRKNMSGMPDSPEQEPAERFGDILRREREKRQVSIGTVSKNLKIHERYIESLESNRYDQMPGDTYIRVYLKSLCTYYSLNSEEILERFFKERGLTGVDTLRKDSSTKINLALREKRGPNVTLIVAVTLIALLAVLSFVANRRGWWSFQESAAGEAPAAKTETGKTVGPDTRETAALPPAREPKDTVRQKAAAAQPADDTARKAKRTANKPAPPVRNDTVMTVRAPAAVNDTSRKPNARERAAKDTIRKTKSPDTGSALASRKDTAAAATSPSPPLKDTARAATFVRDSANKYPGAAPQDPGGPMKLRMTVTGDSCWARVFSDGKQWRKTFRSGQARTFTAMDSFNVHVGANDVVTFTLNGISFTVPGKGVVTFKVDRDGVTRWSLDKWNSVFQSRN